MQHFLESHMQDWCMGYVPHIHFLIDSLDIYDVHVMRGTRSGTDANQCSGHNLSVCEHENKSQKQHRVPKVARTAPAGRDFGPTGAVRATFGSIAILRDVSLNKKCQPRTLHTFSTRTNITYASP